MEPEWMKTEHSMGTSIMAVTYDGGVILGADSRTTTGAYIANRVSDKITPITENVYCCRSGSAADTQAISDYVRYYMAMHSLELGDEPKVATSAKLFRELIYRNKANLLAGIICAGYDKVGGGQVYNITLGGSLMKQSFAISGSGSGYIYGFCDSNFKENMSQEDAENFVVRALALAMSRDGSSGGVIRTLTINKDGVARKFRSGKEIPAFFEGW
eukprot:Plantae.Rhodophyta-Purpureofilum_apyrenoidigerum.ctg6810.p1 GENE.Plantae.Rhodophyta-Purpureofilum_apyrenoidigerum.ctg6810~~Plantae.Rhodophyta-Purpureofilum_apyrenoidigerum.ctg6810.p1  ORF type:complete len:215 (+),score=37.70 Plantae.Rhodophyta-Purpureofilum_apyrenoidigerum.ctg6810:260-904(+)